MPIPSLRELAQVTTPEEARELYISKYGWARSLEFDWVSYDSIRNVWILRRFSIDAQKLTCGCRENEILICKMSVGIIQTCVACGVSTGPISFDDRAVTPLSTSRISKAEGLAKIRASGQHPPIGADSRVQVQTRYQRWKGLNE